MSELYTAQELRERISTNDNRATAKPYLLLLQEKVKYAAHDEFDSGGVEDVYVEFYSEDHLKAATKKELVCRLTEYYDDDLDSLAKAIKSIMHMREGHYWETENVFLTDKGYEDHKKVNGHNLREHRTYGIHAFRNKEIKSLFSLIDSHIDLEQKLEDCLQLLKELNADFDTQEHSYVGKDSDYHMRIKELLKSNL